ncbi:porin family protein [Denitratisoma sp. agr-D3]
MKKMILAALLVYASPLFAEGHADWTGFYGAVLAGRVSGHVNEGDGFVQMTNGSSYSAAISRGIGASIGGWGGSLKLGYNKQLDANLVGIEFGGTWQNAKSKNEQPNTYQLDHTSPTPFVDISAHLLKAQTKINTYETLSLRFGRILDNAVLVYVSGGAALGQIKRTLRNTGAEWFAANTVTSDSKTKSGYVLGVGVEYKWDDKWSFRGNYEYVDFGNVKTTYYGRSDTGASDASLKQSNAVHFSNLSIGVSYAF